MLTLVGKVLGVNNREAAKCAGVVLDSVRKINGVARLDPDVSSHLVTMEAIDGAALEDEVVVAVNKFVVDCKADGIWTPIKACCLLAGARTLAGIFVPLKGNLPVNRNNKFVDADYDRKTGLLGNGLDKCVGSSRASNADPQNSFHIAVYVTQKSSNDGSYIGCHATTATAKHVQPYQGALYSRALNAGAYNNGLVSSFGVGLYGLQRNNSATYNVIRGGSLSADRAAVSNAPSAHDIWVFANSQDAVNLPAQYSNGRIAFYSIGEAIDLVKLHNRIAALLVDLSVAIP